MVVLRVVGHDLRLQVVGGGGRAAHAGGEGAVEDEVEERARIESERDGQKRVELKRR